MRGKMGKIKDLSGQKFGKLSVIRLATEQELNESHKKTTKSKWLCKCDCGRYYIGIGTSLSSGNTKSCGCESPIGKKKHGMFGTKIYDVWHSMKQRCYYSKNISYKNYGGRGIVVCDEWQDFIPFMEWAYKSGYVETDNNRINCTLDRIDVNGNYCPENCRWTTSDVQGNNRRNNRIITYNGITDTITNIARINNVSPVLAEQRYINGWDINDLFISTEDGRNRTHRNVIQKALDGTIIKQWEKIQDIVDVLGYSYSSIRSCCIGKSKFSHGFIWEYLN